MKRKTSTKLGQPQVSNGWLYVILVILFAAFLQRCSVSEATPIPYYDADPLPAHMLDSHFGSVQLVGGDKHGNFGIRVYRIESERVGGGSKLVLITQEGTILQLE